MRPQYVIPITQLDIVYGHICCAAIGAGGCFMVAFGWAHSDWLMMFFGAGIAVFFGAIAIRGLIWLISGLLYILMSPLILLVAVIRYLLVFLPRRP